MGDSGISLASRALDSAAGPIARVWFGVVHRSGEHTDELGLRAGILGQVLGLLLHFALDGTGHHVSDLVREIREQATTGVASQRAVRGNPDPGGNQEYEVRELLCGPGAGCGKILEKIVVEDRQPDNQAGKSADHADQDITDEAQLVRVGIARPW